MRCHELLCVWLIGWSLASATQLWAEEPPPELDPVAGSPVAGAIGSAVVTFELLGRGLIPSARIVVTNTSPVRIRLPRTWTYEVIPQPGILDAQVRTTLPDDADERSISLKDFAYAPEQRVWLTLSERVLFGRSQELRNQRADYRSTDADRREQHSTGPARTRGVLSGAATSSRNEDSWRGGRRARRARRCERCTARGEYRRARRTDLPAMGLE